MSPQARASCTGKDVTPTFRSRKMAVASRTRGFLRQWWALFSVAVARQVAKELPAAVRAVVVAGGAATAHATAVAARWASPVQAAVGAVPPVARRQTRRQLQRTAVVRQRRPLLPHSLSLSRCRPLASFRKTHKLPHPYRTLAMAAAVRRRLGRRHHRGRGFGWPPSLRGAANRGGELRPVQWYGAAGAGAPTRPPCHWQFSLLFCFPSFSALRRRFPSPPAPHGTRFARRHARPEELEGGGGKGGVNAHPRGPPRAPSPHPLRLSPLAVTTTIALTPSPRYEPPPSLLSLARRRRRAMAVGQEGGWRGSRGGCLRPQRWPRSLVGRWRQRRWPTRRQQRRRGRGRGSVSREW